jgi:hypothetical protein
MSGTVELWRHLGQDEKGREWLELASEEKLVKADDNMIEEGNL